MRQRGPLFTKRTNRFTFRVSLMSYRQGVFMLWAAMFIVVIGGVISIYRIVTSPNFTISQVITSVIVTLLLLSSPLIVLRIQKPYKDD